MLFNSLAFLLFFPVVCLLYWILPPKYRNGFLLLASYYFYMSWELWYGILILSASFITWISGIGIAGCAKPAIRKTILCACIISNLSVLFVFKYIGSISYLLWPVGISFYTLQALGYTIDVFRNELPPERNFGRYALFVSFFPQLVAGPIERAKHLLPQFRTVHSFNNAQCLDGLKMMVWGYFMKLCIADRVASYVNAVFNYSLMHNGTSLLLGSFFFTFQIYCDFAGYSLIALGVAKCLGFELMTNFNRPCLARSLQDFWRRWHISLSQWLKDYVYIPLGGNRCSLPRHLLNLFITFVISAIWHGAYWTFVSWGVLHGTFIILGVLKNKYLPGKNNQSVFRILLSICLTFGFVMLSRVFFRANNMGNAWLILDKIFTEPGRLFKGEGIPEVLLAVACIGLLMLKEIKDEMRWNIHFIHNKNETVSTVSLSLMICLIILTAVFTGKAFIYFQF